MRPLEVVLATIPEVYAELEAALVPGGGGTGGDRVSGGTRVTAPDPARLDVIDHRHLLLRGLRWWVDAVRETGAPTPRVGASPARMCAYLRWAAPAMDPADRADMTQQLSDWLWAAYPHVGRVDAGTLPVLPVESLDAVVPQSVAAKALGVHATTILRRAGGKGGPVKLSDVAGPECVQSDLPAAWCAHCRAQ